MNLTIATANSRKEKQWKNREMTWTEFLDKVRNTHRTSETVAEYRQLPKAKQDDIKDCGGFVGGKLKDGRRKNGYVDHRSMLTLDMDYAEVDVWDSIVMFNDYACSVYSTHKHTPEAPRLRLIIPLARAVTPDEYQAVARKVAQDIGMEQFDDTTFEPARLMYWPSTSSDGTYEFQYQDGVWLNPETVLASYGDWKDTSQWPLSTRQKSLIKKSMEKQADPTAKEGVVGTFCRAYSISAVIETFLVDVYEPCAIDDRYSYIGGSTYGGVVTYDDLFAYSHHATDPASGKLCNAFDLVRLHKFGERDSGTEEGVKAPSFKAMLELAKNDALVQETEQRERMEAIQADFSGQKVDPKRLFFKDEVFIPSYMADWFLQRHRAFVMNDDLYIYKNGVYVRDERLFLEEGTVALGEEFRTNRVKEALAYIKNTVGAVGPDDAVNNGQRLNLKNGLLDLNTMELTPHTPDFRTIVQLPVDYDPNADCSAIDAFFKAVVPEDAIPVMEEMAGYCLIISMKYEKALVLYGEGGNGKGTFIAALTNLLGPRNVATVSFQDLTENRFATADLFGKMANLHADIPSKTLENSSQFKELVSGDMIRAEEKNKPSFTFRNRAKLIFSANEPPTSKDNTDGFHRRLLMVPFPHKFTNRELRQRLFTSQALSGFLLRALQGMQRLQQQDGFSTSTTVTNSLLDYRKQSDTVARFLDECCSFDAAAMTGKQAVYDAYRNACFQWGNHPVSQIKFNARLKAIRPEITEYRKGTPRRWRGIKLETEDFLD